MTQISTDVAAQAQTEKPLQTVPPNAPLFALRHLNTGEYIAALFEGRDWLICFTNGDDAYDMRVALGQIEHADVVSIPAGHLFEHFFVDSEFAVLRKDA